MNNDVDTMNAEIQAAVAFAEHLGVNVDSDCQSYHRYRKRSGRIDENPSNATSFTLQSFYRKEFKAVLDTQIGTYTEVHNNSKETTRPLIDTLHPEKKATPLNLFEELTEFFPPDQKPDPEALMSEMEIFRCHLSSDSYSVKHILNVARIAEEQKSVFPLANKAYRLALSAPMTVAKDERTFSKLKLVKTLCRSTINEERLEELLIMACEKDITDNINVIELATTWAALKRRRIQISLPYSSN